MPPSFPSPISMLESWSYYYLKEIHNLTFIYLFLTRHISLFVTCQICVGTWGIFKTNYFTSCKTFCTFSNFINFLGPSLVFNGFSQ